MTGEPRMGRVVRMLAMNAATSAGFDIERIDDVALAVTEAFGAVSRPTPEGPVSCSVEIDDGSLRVDIASDGDGYGIFTIDALARSVLEGTTTDLVVTPDRATISFRIAAAT